MPSTRISDFDTWRPGYGLATVSVLKAGTSLLADVFSDEDLTAPTGNPLTLVERIIDGVSYGRFSGPRYVGEPYELLINSIDQSGVVRPSLTTLEGQDASLATVRAAGGTEDTELEDYVARLVDVRDHGEFIAVNGVGASASTNTATIAAALGVAGARGGGIVMLPPGTYAVTSFTIPIGVVLMGQARGATILQSSFAGNVITLGGARAGLSRITLDGVTLVGGSVGVYSANKDQIVFDDVEIKRFETGLHCRGGKGFDWNELYIVNCVNGYKAHGDSASSGAILRFNQWTGGKIETCSGLGVEFKNVDLACSHQILRGVGFDTNTGTAVKVVGARKTLLVDCWWEGNTVNLNVADGSPLTTSNTVIGLEIAGGSMKNGAVTFAGNLESVVLRRVDLETVAFTFTTPTRNILAEDCREISGVTFAGTATAWVRRKSGDRGASAGVTTGNVATKAWAMTLASGQRAYLEARVIGRQRNGTNDGYYHIATSVRRAGATLPYDTQTGNFTVGNVLVGATSGATARIVADADGGASGTLTLQDVVGVFVDNEALSDGSGGAALANGGVSEGATAVVGTVTRIRADQETNANWDVTFAANGPEIELRVTGDTNQTVEWTAEVEIHG